MSPWQGNPLSEYVRSTEEKAKQKEDARIAKARERAARMIQPRRLPLDKQKRLQELKKVKELRITEYSASAVENNLVPFAFHFLSHLRKHHRTARLAVISSLVVLLFALLHPHLLLRGIVEKLQLSAADAWGHDVLWDILTVLYIFLCSACHFLLCDLALIYAFEALELGHKAGHQVKNLYSQQVRWGVALASFGIMGASIFKATVQLWLRLALWYGYRFVLYVRGPMLGQVKRLILHTLDYIWQSFLSTIVWSRDLILSTWSTFTAGISRFAGGKIVVDSVSDAHFELQTHVAGIVSFCRDVIDASQPATIHSKWRYDAFATAKTLLSYTAVFLLTTLVFFHLAVRTTLQEHPGIRDMHMPLLAESPRQVDTIGTTPDSSAAAVASKTNSENATISSESSTRANSASLASAQRRGAVRLKRTKSRVTFESP